MITGEDLGEQVLESIRQMEAVQGQVVYSFALATRQRRDLGAPGRVGHGQGPGASDVARKLT